jgi:DNA anti-recombination protein RmuC
MTVVDNPRISTDVGSSPRVKARMLEQMAEALEDEVGSLYRRAAAFEEEESILNKEIGERQTEINRLLLKLDAMRAERDRVMEKIELVSHESALMRDRAISCEENGTDGRPDEASTGSVFFRRMMVAQQMPQA